MYVFFHFRLIGTAHETSFHLMHNSLQHQKMADLRKLIADKISADENSLLLLFKEKVVDCEDTPHKLGYLPGMMFCKLAARISI